MLERYGYYPELEAEFVDEAWEQEVRRGSRMYTAWVQHTLNQLMGLRLAVDGKKGQATRGAIRGFQRQNGLNVDGIVGSNTERVMIQALNRTISANREAICARIMWPESLDSFGFDSSTVKPRHQPQISRIAQCIVASQGTSQPVRAIRLIGHTDPVGSRIYNLALGRRRAKSVEQSLQENIERLSPGLAARITFTPESLGETQQIPGGRERARRVEVFVSVSRRPHDVERDLDDILSHIRKKAKRAAVARLSVSPHSRFARVVKSRYLAGYLATPSTATANAAIKAIARQNTSGRVTRVCGEPDYWEQGTPGWNGRPIPAAIRRIPGLGWLPAKFGAATEILTVANRRSLSHIDVPFLLGRRTFDELDCRTRVAQGQDPDFMPNNSINTSQLMHWATGARYAHLGRDRLRELFLAYELWHLEHWDVFGQDPINDMIAEDASRHMATEIRALRLNSRNCLETLNRGFRQARAWVGALLRRRHVGLKRQIKADPPPSTFIHWDKEVPPTSPYHPYRAPSVRRMLANGAPIATVKASPLVKRYIEVYTLIFEGENWEKAFGPIPLTLLQKKMAEGALNVVFRAISALERGAPTIVGLGRS